MRRNLEELVPKLQAGLFRAAFAVCRDRQEAENITQETFLAYFRTDMEFESDEHIRAWLLRVAINKAKDDCRSFWRRNRVDLDQLALGIPFENPRRQRGLQSGDGAAPAAAHVIYLFYYERRPIREIASLAARPGKAR
jgi:RNA polymerase sigma-70 factor (ECF subfamily)